MSGSGAVQSCAVDGCGLSSAVILFGKNLCSWHGSRLFEFIRERGGNPFGFRGDIGGLLAALQSEDATDAEAHRGRGRSTHRAI